MVTTVISLVKCFLFSGQMKHETGGHMAHMGKKSPYTALVEKPEGRTSPGRPGLTGRITLNEL